MSHLRFPVLAFLFGTLLTGLSLPGAEGLLLSSPASGSGSVRRQSVPGTSAEGWSFPKESAKPRLNTEISSLPENCRGVKVAISIALPAETAGAEGAESVWQVRLTQEKQDSAFEGRPVTGVPVRTALPPPGGKIMTVPLESYYPVDPALPLKIRVERLTSDPADTFPGAVVLTGISVAPLPAPVPPVVVESAPGYNSWPFIQPGKDRLVCAYSRGRQHSIDEPERGASFRTSMDGGRTWGPEQLLANAPDECEVVSGKGLDENGGLLLWVRCRSRKEPRVRFDLYRSADGERFEKIAAPEFSPVPMQIMDVVRIPGKGLLCLWFAGNYKADDGSQCWGTLFSRDNGLTWEQKTVESNLRREDWPTEPSVVDLGNGRLLGIGRVEGKGSTTKQAQFQLQSEDGGKSWTKMRTNVTDVRISTPSLILDRETGLLSCYYFFRGRGILNRRTVKPETVWDRPLNWPAPETVALGKPRMSDSGNVNAVAMGDRHLLAYYVGDRPNTSVVVASLPAPGRMPQIVLEGSALSSMGGGIRSSLSAEAGDSPVWFFLKVKEKKQRVGGVVENLPSGCAGVRVEAELLLPYEADSSARTESVWALQLAQKLRKSKAETRIVESAPVRAGLSAAGETTKRIVLESYCPVDPALPLRLRVERRTDDPGDSYPGDVGLSRIIVTPLAAPETPQTVENAPGYNGWPMLQQLGRKMVCTYSRGRGHFVTDPEGNSYSRISEDGGRTWGPESCIFDYPTENVGVTGIGLDENGKLLCWTRSWGERRKQRFEVHRSADGRTFEKVAEPKLSPLPMQIMEPVRIPGKGLLSLWFAGSYKKDDGSQSWGTLLSRDNGLTWEQKTVESKLNRKDWPTEPAMVYLGNGRILGVGRVEGRGNSTEHALFQLQSEDGGETWTKMRTNVTDVRASTPSLVYDPESRTITCYYFYRGRGLLNRRYAPLEAVWNHPLNWSAPETVALGKTRISDSGNVYAAAINGKHLAAYYMGDRRNTAVVMVILPPPGK